MEIRAGTVIAGRFAIERRVGVGGMGAVYRARDQQSGIAVALKALHGHADERRFAREAWTLADVDHPGVVRYLDHGREGDLAYLVMEWLDGEDLAARLARGALGVDDAIALVRGVADAVAAAHARGIVHRDLKPHNIFLLDGDFRRPKLLDFGLARMREGMSTLTVRGAIMGTPGYMAPEQARGEESIGPAADVFALGCVLFECVAGRRPFQAEHRWAQLAKILFEDPPRLRTLCGDVSPALDGLVARMLAKRPIDRPASAGEVLRLLPARGAMESPSSHPPGQSITDDELRLVSVVVVDTAVEGADATAAADDPLLSTAITTATGVDARHQADTLGVLRGMAAHFGGRVERLPSGRVIANFVGSGVAIDLAAQAARWALAVRDALPGTHMVLTTGRAAAAGDGPVGDAIDRAASLLAALPPEGEGFASTIVVDPATAGLLEGRFEIDTTAAGQALRTERLLAHPVRTLLGKPSRFVGRAREMGTLEAIWAECQSEPIARAVLITGEAGIGKSRLWHELAARLGARDDAVEIWTSRCDPISAGASFGVISQLVRRAAGLRDNEPTPERRARLAAWVQTHVDGDDGRRIVAFLGELVGVPYPDGQHPLLAAARLDPFRMGDQIRRAFEDLIVARSAARPLVLVVEDLHWGDLPSTRAIDAALRLSAELPLMVVAMARPEVHDLFPRLWTERDAQEIRLGGLSRRSGEALVQSALGTALDPSAIESIVERSAGNAFYLEELIRGAAEHRDDAPRSVIAMVQARLDGLEPDARRVLRAASVFGQASWPAGIAAVLGEPPSSELTRWIALLRERELLSARPDTRLAGHEELAFRHALVRDAAYATLTDADRTLGHRLAARWLAASANVDPLTLGEHLDQAGEHAEAIACFERAAAQALEGNDFAAVIARVARGVASGASSAALGRLRFLEAQALIWRGEMTNAEAATSEALALLPARSSERYRALGRRAWLFAQRGETSAIPPLLEQLEYPGTPGDTEAARMIARAQITVELALGAPVSVMVAQLEVLEREARLFPGGDGPVRPWIHLISSLGAVRRGDRGRALDSMRLAIEGFEAIGDRRLACLNGINAAFFASEVGAHAEAEALLLASVDAAQRMSLPHTVALAHNNLGLTLLRTGRLEEARRYCQLAVRQFHDLGNVALESNSLIYLASVAMKSGALDEAEACARSAMALLVDVPAQRPHAEATLARILLRQGRADEAVAVATDAAAGRAAVGALKEGDMLVFLANAEALHAVGRLREAAETIAEARRCLLDEVALISDPGLRESCLRAIPEHVQIVELAAALTPDDDA